jgi:tripartite ATP-independent transporter DctP family solute receptor
MQRRHLVRSILIVAVAGAFASSPLPATAQTPKMDATLSGILAKDHLITRAYQMFADKVRERTNGGLNIKVVPNGQLGGIKETIEATIGGNLEFVQVNNASLGNYDARTMLFDLPFIFRDNAHMAKVVRGPIGDKVYADFEKKSGLKVLMPGMPDGPRSVWNSVRAVYKPQDMKGLKIRVMESPIMIATFDSLGAIPTPLPFPEVYMAAKQKVIDGGETPPAGLLTMKAPEVAKYYSLTKHFALPASLGVNAKWFASLPKNYQDAIVASAKDALAWYDKEYDQDEKAAFQEAVRQGMQVNEVNNVDDFRAAVKKVYDDYRTRVGGDAAIDAVVNTK